MVDIQHQQQPANRLLVSLYSSLRSESFVWGPYYLSYSVAGEQQATHPSMKWAQRMEASQVKRKTVAHLMCLVRAPPCGSNNRPITTLQWSFRETLTSETVSLHFRPVWAETFTATQPQTIEVYFSKVGAGRQQYKTRLQLSFVEHCFSRPGGASQKLHLPDDYANEAAAGLLQQS